MNNKTKEIILELPDIDLDLKSDPRYIPYNQNYHTWSQSFEEYKINEERKKIIKAPLKA